jgi:cell division inhibitor SepF
MGTAAALPAGTTVQATDLTRITTLHPRTYNEARTIGEHFREGTPVIMNLTEMVDSDAKRLVDFAAGLIFGLRGSIERVTNKVFLLSPANIEVTAEDKARMAERGFFNQS